MENRIQDQERELLEGYRQLKPEAKRFIMSMVITAVTAESAIKRQYGLPAENGPVRAVLQVSDGEIN
jgi:hypothetical protein